MLKKIFLFIICFILVERFTYFQTGGFTPSKITFNFPLSIQTPANEENPDCSAILKQPFHYLDKGVQFYAFISEDGESVLKFVKHKSASLSNLTTPKKKIERRLSAIFKSCMLANENLKEETGIMALHLTPETSEKRIITLIDACGIAHQVDLNATCFILQKKAHSFFETFEKWRKEGDKEKAKEAVLALIDLIEKRQALNVYNRDSRVRNFGFVGDQPIEIDLGSFSTIHEYPCDPFDAETMDLKKYLENYDGQLAQYFTEKIKKT